MKTSSYEFFMSRETPHPLKIYHYSDFPPTQIYVAIYMDVAGKNLKICFTKEMNYPFQRGIPSPLGVSRQGRGVNFALFSQGASSVTLVLFNPGSLHPFLEVPFNPKINKTGVVWHIALENLPGLFDYGYKLSGSFPKAVFSDPYGKELSSSLQWGSGIGQTVLGRWNETPPFDWGCDTPPAIAFQDLVIYEMHVRGLTQDSSSHVQAPGTYSAIIEKIPYLKELGVNAVELLPIFEFDECENPRKNPKTAKRLYNYWGYSTVNYFTPMKRFSSSGNALSEFKTVVKELHKNRIEVILDVVYNHTAEGNEKGRTFSFRGIDAPSYYMIGPSGQYLDFTGCGNTVNGNHQAAMDLILDSLRYWVSEMHVDGFRFDLASALTRASNGAPLSDPPLIAAIAKDPILAKCKLIAEAWDAGGLYQVGTFPSHGRFAEWNGKYRDVVRKFIKGTDDQAGAFASVLSGSQDLYGHDRKPFHSINFVTAHDGFSLYDLVSYNEKHNLENGEENRDGMNDNESWNCGQEGPSCNPKITKLRQRQMRNFVAALMVSIGTPMVLMGDEYGHTRQGNNNTWCHDDQRNWFLWGEISRHEAFHRFFRKMIAFRKTEPLLRRTEFLTPADVDWHGHAPMQADWGPQSRFVAWSLKDLVKEEHLYIAFNADVNRPAVQLPDPPPHKNWYRIVDTALSPPCDFLDEPTQYPPLKGSYKMEAYSTLIVKALSG